MSTNIVPKSVSEYMKKIGAKGGKARTKKKIAAGRRNIARATQALRKLFPKDEG